jgi:flagellar basal-body rod modification protein FlgD
MTTSVDISGVSQNNSIYNKAKPYEQKSSLGKDDFLKILTTQLSNQDPSNPLKDQDFIAQMATFSTLEQMTNLNASFEQFASLQMSQYASSIGKEITWTPADGTAPLTGAVNGVSSQDGKYFYLVGDNKVPMESVTMIKQTSTNTN